MVELDLKEAYDAQNADYFGKKTKKKKDEKRNVVFESSFPNNKRGITIFSLIYWREFGSNYATTAAE